MNNHWQQSVDTYAETLAEMRVTDGTETITADEGFKRMYQMTSYLRGNRGTIYLIGNGASASMASHLAADLAKNAKIHTQVFSDLSLLTAIANDLSFDEVFAEPLRTRASRGDALVAISSSGESPNILAAAKVAKEIGMHVITFTAFSPENRLGKLGALNFYVAAKTYGLAESCHSMMLHHWMDSVSIEEGS